MAKNECKILTKILNNYGDYSSFCILSDQENHIKEFGGRDAPEASQGQTRDVPGTPGTFGPDLCVNQY